MRTNSAVLVFFSPTGTTAAVVEAIARGAQIGAVQRIDLTIRPAPASQYELARFDLAIVGAPVYCGRIPPVALSRLRKIKGNNTPAVVVAVYGNRDYEDALLELRDVCGELGLVPIAGGAFIGEHSYSTAMTPIASGRPDPADVAEAERFGWAVRTKTTRARSFGDLGTIVVPGKFPYTEKHASHCASTVSPVTSYSDCTLCGKCASVCPTEAIVVSDSVVTDGEACIMCTACVKSCPTGARSWQAESVTRAAKSLSANFQDRRMPETYL
jgi:ferredoxin/flavodoxin